VAQIATLVALARLLPPQAFGLLAMVAAISALLDLVKEFGLSAATIQRSDITHAQVSALFWINASVGLLFAAAAGRLMTSFLLGATRIDWSAFAAVAGAFTAIAVIACYVPARRATKIDAMEALRYE